MQKAYSRTTWKNDSPPALNQTNLNKESGALDTIDDRVIELYNKTANLEGYQVQAQKAVTDAQNIASKMATDAQAIKNQFNTDAQSIKNQLNADAQAAISRMSQDSTSYINQSKSWAIGEGYPERADQATDNSKYYAEMAEQVAVRNGYVNFLINESGHLIMIKTSTVTNLDFEIKDNSNLFVVIDDGN